MAEDPKQALADAELTVGVLRKLLADAESRAAACRSMLGAEDKSCRLCGAAMTKLVGRFGPYYSCSKYPACRYTTSDRYPNADVPATTPEAKEHYESHLETNHRSASALNAFDLRKAFLEYLRGPWPRDGWVGRSDMCKVTKAWLRWGKHVVDPTLNEMVAEGLIEIRSNSNGVRQVRLKAPHVQSLIELPTITQLAEVY